MFTKTRKTTKNAVKVAKKQEKCLKTSTMFTKTKVLTKGAAVPDLTDEKV